MSVVVAIHYQIYLIIEWNQRRVDEEEENWRMHTLSYDDDVLRFWNYVSVCVCVFFGRNFFFDSKKKKEKKRSINWIELKEKNKRERERKISFNFHLESHSVVIWWWWWSSSKIRIRMLCFTERSICTAHRFFFCSPITNDSNTNVFVFALCLNDVFDILFCVFCKIKKKMWNDSTPIIMMMMMSISLLLLKWLVTFNNSLRFMWWIF